MAVPKLTFYVSKYKVSKNLGYDYIYVGFSSDIEYETFECRATKVGDPWGIGKGKLVAAFSQTPANTNRSFNIFDYSLVNGDGEYRISLFAKSMDGEWNTTTTVLSAFEFPFENALDEPELQMGVIQDEEDTDDHTWVCRVMVRTVQSSSNYNRIFASLDETSIEVEGIAVSSRPGTFYVYIDTPGLWQFNVAMDDEIITFTRQTIEFGVLSETLLI